MEYNKVEQEVLSLWTACESIRMMTNRAMFDFYDQSEYEPGALEVRPKTSIHQSYFLILFIDFLSVMAPSYCGYEKATCLDVLRSIAREPQFNVEDSISALQQAVSNLDQWLAGSFEDVVYFSELEFEANLEVSRKDLIFICGNACKHHALRLTGVGNKIKMIFKQNGLQLKDDEVLTAISSIHTWFYDQQVSYYMTQLAQMTVAIKVGIFDYLRPEYKKVKEGRRIVKHPDIIQARDAVLCYHDLIYRIHASRRMKPFTVIDVLKQRY